MRKALTALFVVLPLVAAALPAAAFDAASEARYQGLLADAKAGKPVDWGALRLAYADSAEFDLRGGRTDAARKAMFAAVNAGNDKGALIEAKAILDQDYVDIDAHVVADLADAALGDAAGAAREHDIVVGLLRSVRTGDGSGPATAFTVITVGEEYAVMRALAVTVNGQALIQNAGHSYDVLDVTDAAGNSRRVYFLIDRIIAAEGAAVKPRS